MVQISREFIAVMEDDGPKRVFRRDACICVLRQHLRQTLTLI